MKLKLFKTLWGHEGTLHEAAEMCHKAGFAGLEAPVPLEQESRTEFIQFLEQENLSLIAEICTETPPGIYVPTPGRTPQNHLDSLREGVERSLEASPIFINTMSGSDAWTFREIIEFHSGIPELENEYGIAISAETHRGRSLNNPWTTRDVLQEIPDLKITCDFSHFCVVAERLVLNEEPEILALCAEHAFHVQTRVGYDQGPQVPDPRDATYGVALASHEAWWDTVWRSQEARGFETSTLSPEFGPDGYLQCEPFTRKPVADLWEINQWIAHRQRDRFNAQFQTN